MKGFFWVNGWFMVKRRKNDEYQWNDHCGTLSDDCFGLFESNVG